MSSSLMFFTDCGSSKPIGTVCLAKIDTKLSLVPLEQKLFFWPSKVREVKVLKEEQWFCLCRLGHGPLSQDSSSLFRESYGNETTSRLLPARKKSSQPYESRYSRWAGLPALSFKCISTYHQYNTTENAFQSKINFVLICRFYIKLKPHSHQSLNMFKNVFY